MNLFSARLETAKEIAKSAGKLATSYQLKMDSLSIESKGPHNWVTEADIAVENHIRDRIKASFPNDKILGEELGCDNKSLPIWVIDPIDGTSNFTRGIPFWSIVLAWVDEEGTQIGVVYDPVTDELFYAEKDLGAWKNGERIQCSKTEEPKHAVLGIGHAWHSAFSYHDIIDGLRSNEADYRRFGSAALSLAHTACGRIDGYYERFLNSWDFLAGALLVQEAGGKAVEASLQEIFTGCEVYATNKHLNIETFFPTFTEEQG
ncbi:inositol monophosphatase [Vibrio kyushuensis]|uniref:inositol monophosphatase family protein n=1 Tax=Vibrio kyushuensis TaxID=2910249 RepID=UPI003D0A16FA